MVNIGLIINRELANKETFYLPGLGTFKKEYVPASFNESEQLFTPPAHGLLFVKHDIDRNLLTEHLTGSRDLSLIESKNTSIQIIDQLETVLRDKEESYIEGLGALSFNQYDQLVIIPRSDEAEFDIFEAVPEIETLPPREQAPQSEEERAAQSEETPDTEESSNTEEISPLIQAERISENAPIPSPTPLDEFSTENELDPIEQEGNSKRWLWPVIGVALCVIIAGVWYLNPVQNQRIVADVTAEATDSLGQSDLETDTHTMTQAGSASNESIDTAAANGQADSTNTRAEELPMAESKEMVRRSTGRYEIIIAAFETMQEAKEYVQITNAKGHNVYILQNNRAGNMNKISYASFDTPEEASASLAKIRNELASEAWLWENKNYNNHN